ncbi:hypothetical protein [Kocuria palustris]|jgi:hypothetical protein|uniref:hypothetical protein n=1 Tax=Kocuria palustris TaxID=71999 RepID=UPI0035DD9D09
MLKRWTRAVRRPRKVEVTEPIDLPGLAREFSMFESRTAEGRFVGWSLDHGMEARDLFLFVVQLPGWTWDGTGAPLDVMRRYPWPYWMSVLDADQEPTRSALYRVDESVQTVREVYDELIELTWWVRYRDSETTYEEFRTGLHHADEALARLALGNHRGFSDAVDELDQLVLQMRRVVDEVNVLRDAIEGTSLDSAPPDERPGGMWGQPR